MIEYLLEYIEDYELDYIKQHYTVEVIDLLECCKEKVINKINELKKKDENVDIYMELMENINQFF